MKRGSLVEARGGCGRVPRTVRAVITITSCFFVQCTLGFTYTFGNINPYVTSYLRNNTRGDHTLSYSDTLWVPQSLGIAQCITMPFLGLLSTRIPQKLYLFIGVLFSAASFFGCYGGLQTSFALTVVTYGVLGGCSHAVLYPGCLSIALRWVPDKRGLITGLVLTGYGVGAVAWNQLTTWYINRHNLQPDLTVGQDIYFTQRSVLDRVPSCFLLMGTIFTAVQFLSVLIMCQASAHTMMVTIKQTSCEEVETQSLLAAHIIKQSEPYLGKSIKSRDGTISSEGNNEPMNDRHDCSPREVIRSRVFWTLWTMMAFTLTGTSVFGSLFKAYGQTFIRDDHFLTLVASFSSVFNALGRPFWGLLADRWGIRNVFLAAQVVLGCLMATFITCEQTGKAGFFVWVCGMYLTMCGVFTMVPAIVFSLFGARYFNINMGLMDFDGILSSVLVVIVIPVLKDSYGWHTVFFVAFGVIFVGILLNMSLGIKCKKSRHSSVIADTLTQPQHCP